MIIVIKQNPDEKQLNNLVKWVRSLGLEVHMSRGENTNIMGLIGDTSAVDIDLIRSLDIVETVKRIQEPYKNANRKFHPQDTVVSVGGYPIGGGHFQFMAGPCSVESEEQVIAIAKAVKEAGATILRGGAFKPRTSPYAFQGLGESGIQLLLEAKRETGMPIVTELMSVRHIDAFRDVDMIQIGARNMQNFELLKEVGRTDKPILLKRGLANTIQEWLMSAEYIMSEGNMNVVLCERGIRTFEPYTRNTLDLSAIPLLRDLTHLPIIVDPSHASGISKLVAPMSLAAVGAGTDGLMIEVHNNPACALCDGPQALTPEQFADVVKNVDVLLPIVHRVRDGK
ncbi:MAG TPA: 3-deoxy-7-phosphoheptulonate synthase [Candidatus Stercoripulliclostridium merdipullorum]|uniref:3-deoxy-7-phosphoheptulonate synthase n=1 Tax=Candidatus Stercoripulliclostridium merdipullorum TaxID=2840952 RepID=A0A9D1NBN9_9FIRM|nr:3-deoxy-7-phosphoheptulonate synthase [Candidatus Stercoripulliclostridium merdipullorum]